MKRKFILPLLLPVFVAILIGINFISNESSDMEVASVSLVFPNNAHINGWTGTPKQESAEERKILAEDTEFSKMEFVENESLNILNETSTPRLTAQASIVLSGHDMNNSIHRPEYCLPAQGHFDMKTSSKKLHIKKFGDVTISQISTKQNITPNDREPTVIDCIHYYIFIGNKQITHNHFDRLFRDVRDRIFFGKVQRWAYFQVSTPYGALIGRSKEDAEKATEDLIDQILSQIIDWDAIKENQ